jgi:glutathione S-transferase
MMTLYYSPGACSLASHVTLLELGLQFEAVKVNLRTRQTQSGADFTAINPKARCRRSGSTVAAC